MKIKKVDDKPMVIHTKQKTQLHAHEPKNSTIKGSNIYTVDRSPKKGDSEIPDTKGNPQNGTSAYIREKAKRRFRKSTVHQADVKEKGIAKFRRNIRGSNQSIKLKNQNLHSVRRTSAIGAKTVTDQMDGGQEVQQAGSIVYELSRPVTGTASKGAELFRHKSMEKARRKIKKVDAGKNIAKKKAKDTAKNIAKESAKETAKVSSKVAAKTAVTAAGTAVAPGAGTAIGMVAGYAAGVAVEAKDAQITNRHRKIKFFMDKMKAEDQQQDSVARLIRDLVTRKAILWVKTVAPIVLMLLLPLILVVALVAAIVMVVVGVIYNSPFALFMPPLDDGETVQSVASAYVAEFNREVNTLANEHTGYDSGKVVYVGYEGTDAYPSNYYDILGVYMVKHGVGDTATVMNDTSKGWLQTVVNDMCTYTVSSGTEDVTITNEDGTTTTTTQTVLYVNVTLKTYVDMISQYSFNEDQEKLLREFMSPEYLTMLGWNPGGGSSNDPGVSTMSESEIQAALALIPEGKAKKACDYAFHRVGYPYSQELRHSGKYYDCSSLAYYAWLDAGVDISYGGATTASWEAKGLADNNKTVVFEQMQPGDLIFYSHNYNGQYLNITHVAIYVGGGKVVEARGTAYGVVYRDTPNLGSIVMIGRPD